MPLPFAKLHDHFGAYAAAEPAPALSWTGRVRARLSWSNFSDLTCIVALWFAGTVFLVAVGEGVVYMVKR